MEDQSIVSFVVTRYENMAKDAQTWQSIVEDVAKYCAPSKQNIRTWSSPSQQEIDGNLYDTTAIQANNTLAAGSLAYMTPISEVWFSTIPPKELSGDDEVVSWYARCSEVMRQELSRSNFYLESHEVLLDRGWAGTSAMHCEMRDNGALWFKHFEAGRFFIAEDDYGLVDTVCRVIKLSNRQAVMHFGIDHVSETTRKAVTENKGEAMDDMRDYIHMVFPRPDEWRLKNEKGEVLKDAGNKPVAEVYVDKDAKILCRNGGYEEMPIFVTRWEKMRGEVYGVSPAMKCLPTIRELNYLQAVLAAQGEKAVFPPMLIPDSLEGMIDMSPRGITVYDSNRPDAIPRELSTFSQYMVGTDQVDRKQQEIRDTFFVDMFQTFMDSTKRMATFEAMQLADEKLVLFHPSAARYYSEFIGPILERVFALLLRAKKFPDLPDSLLAYADAMGASSVLTPPEYTSRIAQALQAVRMKSSWQLLQILPTLAAFDQGVGMNFDFNKMARGFSRTLNVPEEYLREDKQVKQLKQQQQQQIEAERQLKLAAMGAGAAKDAADAGLLARSEG